MDTSKLAPDTARIWAQLNGHPLLKGFILIGGTALTMHIGHRVSEDLDFACTQPLKHLPRPQIKALIKDLAQKNVSMVLDQHPLDVEEFSESGLDLNNYQQNYIANDSVKVSLVCYDPPMDQFLPGTRDDPLRVATLGELFATKAYVCSERSKTRDWLDLYTLISEHGYSFQEVYDVYKTANRLAAFAIMVMRLRKCQPEMTDEGYLGLMEKPPSVDSLRHFFNQELDQLERHLAKQAFLIHKAT